MPVEREPSPLTRRLQAARRCIVLAALHAAIIGCTLAAPPPTFPASTSHSAPTDVASATPDELATERPPAYDPTRITQICESWGGRRAEQTITCGRGIKAALDALGAAAGTVERVDLRYSLPCEPTTSCPPRRQDRAWVTLHTPLGEDRLIELTIRPGTEVIASLRGLDPAPPVPPRFVSPGVERAAIEPPVPHELRDREPLPLCGVEHAASGGPYETDARRCFRDSVQSGQPAEFLTMGPGTEGDEALTLYRFLGNGAVIRFDREGGAWSQTACGITVLRTDVVFATDGVCRRGPLAPGR